MPLFLLIVTYSIYWVVQPDMFSDYEAYLSMIDSVYFTFTIEQIFSEEGLSKLVLYLGRYLTNSNEAAHGVIVGFIQFIFFAVVSCIYVKNRKLSQSLIYPIALFAPLITAIVIRNSFSYLLITIACFYYFSKHWFPFYILFLIAFFFHTSTILLLPIFLVSGLGFSGEFLRTKARLWVPFLFFCGIFLIFSPPSLSFLTAIDSLETNLGARSAYIQDDRLTVSMFHYAWLVFVSMCYWFFIPKIKCVVQLNFFSFSFLTYIVLLVSPVAAFRFSIFFLIPFLIIINPFLSSNNWKSVRSNVQKSIGFLGVLIFTYFNLANK
jgi:hypothetical protein